MAARFRSGKTPFAIGRQGRVNDLLAMLKLDWLGGVTLAEPPVRDKTTMAIDALVAADLAPLSDRPVSAFVAALIRQAALLRRSVRIAFHLVSNRFVSVIGLVVALWLCPVQTFAHLGPYLAAVNLATLAIFGRFELLIIGARSERQRNDALQLCLLIGTGGLLAVLVVGLALQHHFIGYVTLCFAGALFARAWLRLGLMLATRNRRYDRAARALLPHSIAQPFILVFLIEGGHDPFMAFVLADLFGQLIAAACVSLSEAHAFAAGLRQSIRFRHIGRLASENIRLTTVSLPAATSAFLFAAIPLLFLPSLPDAILAGTLALLFRLLDVPTDLTVSSLNPILLKEVTDSRDRGVLRLSRITFLMPAAVATTVFASISLGGLTLDWLELAPKWHMALTVLPAVALFQAGIAANTPLIDIATLAGRQRGLLALNLFSVAAAAAALLLWRDDPIVAILVAGAIGFARVVIMSIWLAGTEQRVSAVAVRVD